MQKHFERKENIKRGMFTLTYDYLLKEVLTDWKKHKYISDAKCQLKILLEDLKNANIIFDYEMYEHQVRDKNGKRLKTAKEDGEFRIDFYLKTIQTKPQNEMALPITEQKIKENIIDIAFETKWAKTPYDEKRILSNKAIESMYKKYPFVNGLLETDMVYQVHLKLELKTLLGFN